jgi:predicted acyltransferase
MTANRPAAEKPDRPRPAPAPTSAPAPAPARPPAPPPASSRLASLDVMRGFDMFWITGGGTFIVALVVAIGYVPLIDVVKHQIQHAPWAGLRAEDLIFPIFVFMSGATMPFALTARLGRGERKRVLYWRLFRRMIALVALGLSTSFFRLDFANMRPLSVLGLIGVAYFLAGLIVLNRGVWGQLAWAGGILLGYWAALYFIAVPGVTADRFSPGGSLVSYIDYHLLPGKLYGGVFDPEGILCFFPAAAMALIGAGAGRLLQTQTESPYRNVLILLGCGAASVALGFLWNPWFPITKAIWSSSFILAAGGFGLIFLALFYLVIDVWRQRWLGFVFIPVGMNAITIYVARMYVDFDYTAQKVFGGLTRVSGERFGPLVAALGVLVVEWAILYFLYRKKIFLRV